MGEGQQRPPSPSQKVDPTQRSPSSSKLGQKNTGDGKGSFVKRETPLWKKIYIAKGKKLDSI